MKIDKNIIKELSDYLNIFYLQQVVTINIDLTSETMINKFTNQVSDSLKECVELPNIRKYIKHHFNKNCKLYISSKSNKDDIINTIADLMELGISDYFLTHG